MAVLQNELNLIIDDFSVDSKRRTAIQGYHELLVDYMTTCGATAVIHVKGSYMPYKVWEG